MKKSLLFFSFLVFLKFLTPNIAYSEVVLTEEERINLRISLEKQIDEMKENILAGNSSIGIIFRDFPYEWDDLKSKLIEIGERNILQAIQTAKIVPSKDGNYQWVSVAFDLPAFSQEIIKERILLIFRYLPYYLSQADDLATLKFLEAKLNVLNGYNFGEFGNSQDCNKWLSNGILNLGPNISLTKSEEVFLSMEALFQTASPDKIREIGKFGENPENMNLFMGIFKKLHDHYKDDSGFPLNYLLVTEVYKNQDDQQLACIVNEEFFQYIGKIKNIDFRAKFFREYILFSGGLEEKVENYIATRKQILSTQ